MTAEDIAGYLDGTLGPEDRDRVEAVLAANPDARAELVEASRLLATMPQPRQRTRRPWLITSAAAAAVFLLAVGPSLVRRSPVAPVATERHATITENQQIGIISPAEGAAIGASEPRFTWNVVDGATYKFALTDAEGRAVWQTTTSDTTVVIPSTPELRARETYYWNVDALAATGASTTTGVHSFTIAAK